MSGEERVVAVLPPCSWLLLEAGERLQAPRKAELLAEAAGTSLGNVRAAADGSETGDYIHGAWHWDDAREGIGKRSDADVQGLLCKPTPSAHVFGR